MKLPDVKWKATRDGKQVFSNDDDDFIFKYKKYCLRVEQMHDKNWWWCVYYADDYLEFDDPSASTCEQAMDYAMAGFYADLVGS